MPKTKTAGIHKVGDRQFKIDTIVLVNGKRVHVRASGFKSAQEAKEAMPALIEAKRKAVAPLTSDKTFDTLVTEFERYRSTQSKAQTVEGIHYMIGKHIMPTFSGLKVNEALTYDRVGKWYRAKCSSGDDSANQKNRVFATMRQIIECAWKWRYITSEVYQDVYAIVENIRMPNRAKADKGVWTYEQEQKFLSVIPKDSIDYPMFSLFCYLGCRLGEFQGLQWKCFDAEHGVIAIGQQVVRIGGGTVLSDELKTNESYRMNQLDASTLNLLLRYRSTLNSSADDEFIFPSPYNSRTPLSRTEFRRRFNQYIERSGVPKIVPHGVRHSKATMLAGVCHNAEEVAVGAKFLGHSPSMFMGTYVSQSGVSQGDLISRLGK